MERTRHPTFDALYRAHHRVVERCVASFGLPRDIWPDILQDVWMSASRRLDEVLAHPKPSAWLCTAARNHAMHHVRGHLRRKRKLEAAAVEPARDADDPIRERDAWDTLSRLLDDCPLEQREVYLKIELHGMTAGEVADELGVSVNTVHSRLRLTRQRLRESSAALAALLLTLRARLAEEGLGASLAASDVLARASAPAALQRPHTPGTVGQVALFALLIAPGGSPPDLELRLEQPEVAALAESPDSLDSVHTRAIQRPWASPPAPPSINVEDRREPAPAPRRAPARPRATAKPTAAKPGPGPRLAPVDDGEALLSAAQKAYREGRFERALQHAEQHRRLHPASELRDAREALIVESLCQLGRDDDARAHVRTFARESPDERAFRARLAKLREGCR